MSNLQNVSSLKFMHKALILMGLMLFTLLLNLNAHAQTLSPTLQTIEDSYFQEAEDLLKRGRFDEAYELYRRLFRDNPLNDRIVLGFAVSANRMQKWNQALMAYEILLERYPNDPDLLAELVNLYMLLGDKETADRTLAHAQSLGLNTLNQISLDKLEERYNTLQVNGNLRLGFMYDTNVNGAPATENIMLGNWQVTIPNAAAIASPGGYVAGNLDLAWKKYRDSRLWLVSTTNLYARSFFSHELSSMNVRDSQWAKINLGGRYMGVRHLLDVRAKADIFAYQLDQNVLSFGPEISYYFLASPTDSFYTTLSIDYQKNTDSLDMSLDAASNSNLKDGWYGKIHQHWRHTINRELGYTLKVGYLFGNAIDTARPQFDYQGMEAGLSFDYTTPINIVLTPSILGAIKNYDAPNTMLESDNRKDITLRAGLAAKYTFADDWAIDAAYNYTNNMSNSGLAEYEQHAVTTGLTWSF